MHWLLRLLLARLLLAIDCATAALGLADIANGRHVVFGCAAMAAAALAVILALVLVYPGPHRRYAPGRRCR
jgi:hypothetical protein